MNQNFPMNILFGFDGSEHSFAAISLLDDLFSSIHDKPFVNLLTVITPRQATDHAAIQIALDKAADYLDGKNFAVKPRLILGYPAEKILEYSNDAKPDLIVVGAKGLRATLGILLGGVAQQVVEYSRCPVLVVRAPYEGLNRGLLVTDGSEYSKSASSYVENIPLPKGLNWDVLHVLPPIPIQPSQEYISHYLPVGPDIYPPPPLEPVKESAGSWQESEEKEGQTIIQDTVDILSTYGISANGILRHGDAATEIINYVKNNTVDLVVAGSRGLSQIRGLLLGTVSRKLVHYADCSILIVKGDQ